MQSKTYSLGLDIPGLRHPGTVKAAVARTKYEAATDATRTTATWATTTSCPSAPMSTL
jgi:hypothetical protein